MIKYNGKNTVLAKNLRKRATPQENHLWYDFLAKYEVRFQRQKPIGDFIADLIGFLGIRAIRGSSKKKAFHALFNAFDSLKNGYNISFTPDGPGGPKYSMSRGPIVLASQLQSPIIPVSINAKRYWQCRSWDGFQIPKPFTTLTLIMGDAIEIPADLTREEIIEYQEKVRQSLMAITED